MNKLLSKIAALSVGLAMAVGVGVAINQEAKEVKAAISSDYTLITSVSDLANDDKVVLYNSTDDEGVTGWNENKDATTGSSGWLEYVVTKSSNKFTLSAGDGLYVQLAKGSFKHLSTASELSVTSNGYLCLANDATLILYRQTSYVRGYQNKATDTNYHPFAVYKVNSEPAKTVDSVTGVNSHPETVYQNKSVDPEQVILNVHYDDGSSGTEKATSVVCDTSALGEVDAVAYYNLFAAPAFKIQVVEQPPVQDVEFNLTSVDPITIDGITVSFAQGAGQSAPAWNTDSARLYAKNTVTVSSSGESFTNITFDWIQQSGKDFAGLTADKGEYTHPTTTGEGVWEGEETSVVFTLGETGRLLINRLVVGFGSAKQLASVTLGGAVTKKNYYAGEKPSVAGLTVTAHYDDDSSKDVTSSATITSTPVTLSLEDTSVKYVAEYKGVQSNELEVNDIVVSRANPIQSLYTKAAGTNVEVYGVYVGLLPGTGPVIMDGEYGIVAFDKTHDVSGYTEGETILKVSGSLSIYKGLYEIGTSSAAPTITVVSEADVETPVIYAMTGLETSTDSSLANRLTTASGTVKSVATNIEGKTLWTDDTIVTLTVAGHDVLVFCKGGTVDSTDSEKIVSDMESEKAITIKGFTNIYEPKFQLYYNSIVEEKKDYTAEQFALDLLAQTSDVCDGWEEGVDNKAALTTIWSDLASADKYPSLPDEQKQLLINAQASETGDNIQKAMARYDFLTGKYNLNSFISGREIQYSSYSVSNINYNPVYVIIIVASALTITAFGLVLIIRKKKTK